MGGLLATCKLRCIVGTEFKGGSSVYTSIYVSAVLFGLPIAHFPLSEDPQPRAWLLVVTMFVHLRLVESRGHRLIQLALRCK